MSVTAVKDDVLSVNALRPIGSNLAVNQVLRMSTQPRNSRLAPIVRSRVLCRIFDAASCDPVDSSHMLRSDPVKYSSLSKELSTDGTSGSATMWKACLHCLDFVDTQLQLPKIYYEQRVSIVTLV